MGTIKESDHEALKMWALENGYGDPDKLIVRSCGNILYAGQNAMKQYKRLQKMYQENKSAQAVKA